MGCLFELFFEFFINIILEATFYVYQKLVTLIIPDKVFTEKDKQKIRNITATALVIMFLSLFLGILFLLPGNPVLNTVGRFMTFIPLTLYGILLLLGIIVAIVKAIRKRGS